MSSGRSKSKATAQHKDSGFSLDYACSFSVKQGKNKARSSAEARRKERWD